MTFYFDSDRNVIVENHPDFVEEGEDGEMVMVVEEMPQNKLRNIKKAAEDAIEYNND